MSSTSRPTRTNALVDEESMEQAEAAQPQNSNTMARAWVEPALRAPAPSFKEYPHLAIERHGVLTEMAPLGTMPSSKLKKAAAVKSDGSKQVTMVKKADASGVSTPRELSTPEPVVSPVRRRSGSRRTEDADWAPKTPIAQTSGRKSAAKSVSVASHSAVQQMSPSMSLSPSKPEHQGTITDRVIESACDQALSANRYLTAYAIDSLYNAHRENRRIVTLFEAIFKGRGNSEQKTEFRTLMTWKKREGKKNDEARKYFEAKGTTLAAESLFSNSYSLATPSKRAAPHDPAVRSSKSPQKEAGHVSKKHKGNNHAGTSPFVTNGAPVSETNMAELNKSDASRARSKSVTSNGSSALSSLDEDILREDFAPSVTPTSHSHAHSHANKSATTTATTTSEQNNALAPTLVRYQHEPITASKLLGPKLHAFSTTTKSKSTTPSSSTPSATRHAEENMPSAYPPPSDLQNSSEPSLQTPSSALPTHHITIKAHKKAPANAVPRRLDENDRSVQLRRKAKKVTDYNASILDSFERETRFNGREQSSDSELGVGVVTRASPIKSGQVLRLRGKQTKRKANDDFDDARSTPLLSPLPDLGPGSAANSRAGTPSGLGRPVRKGKTGGLRTKTSPMKNKAGPSAGIPRASGERNSPIGNGHGQQEENDDYCSSCGGNGDLVCCDGCTRSFHFRCVDPPMIDTQLPDTWFCNKCNVSRNPPIKANFGSFGELFLDLETRNPSAFHLPKQVREYFENVRTGTEGEYEEGPVPPKTRHHRSGYDEAPDHLKLKDGKGNFILCHHCHQGPTTKGSIITCSYCALSWHLDCLDPPLSNPPPAGRMWRCPCHVDDMLAKVPGTLAPAHRFRRIKGASVIRPTIQRGTRNNGHIEVEFAPSDDEDEGFFEQKEFGQIYKLHEDGIKLDFISKCHTLGAPRSISQAFTMEFRKAPRLYDFSAQDVKEQQAALNLALLAKSVPDRAQTLIDALMSEASPAIIDIIAQGDAAAIAGGSVSSSNGSTKRNKQSLLAIKALVEAQLQKLGSEIKEEDAMETDQEEEQQELQKVADTKSVTEEKIFDAIVEQAEEEVLNDPMET